MGSPQSTKGASIFPPQLGQGPETMEQPGRRRNSIRQCGQANDSQDVAVVVIGDNFEELSLIYEKRARWQPKIIEITI
jgi:hypothetical protein